MDVEIRSAVDGDVETLSSLLTRLTREYVAVDCTTAGLDRLLTSMTADAIRQRMRDDFRHWVALADDHIVGICAVKGESHLYHLFVVEWAQRMGVARQLWEKARDDSCKRFPGTRKFTVNSSSKAVAAYERLGFLTVGGIDASNGVTCQPMHYSVSRSGQT
jgi:ribosomal protein S18 acetylase RimI-like enzyme